MPSDDITGDSNFGTILESKVCVSAFKSSMSKSSTLEASMTNRHPAKTILTSQHTMVDTPMLAQGSHHSGGQS